VIFDSISDFNTKENQLIVIVSSGCKYCKLGMKKLSLMMKKEELSAENIDVFIWGSPEGIVNFRKETMTEDYDYWHIMPNKAIEITYGRFPIFIWIKEKDIIKVGDFRDLDDAFFK
jgi:thiol-disulfide isomerase/thioredoxin